MKISIITLFPDFIEHYINSFGILLRAVERKLLKWQTVNLRDFGLDARGTVDDRPYGGGVGMVLRPDVVYKAIKKVSASAKAAARRRKTRIIMLSPRGKTFTQKDAEKLKKYDHLIFVTGRYEGIDERVSKYVDDEYSIGDYVLMGGELPALVISEAVLRLLPGVLGKIESTEHESFSNPLLEHPQYTKPEIWKNGKVTHRVPKVLLSGNHADIETFRNTESLKRTKKFRPDLFQDKNKCYVIPAKAGIQFLVFCSKRVNLDSRSRFACRE